MKAERRHELQTNSLALWMRYRAPDLWQKYGNYILLGVVVAALLAVIIHNRIQKPTRDAERAATHLANAREIIEQLRHGLLPRLEDARQARSFINQAMEASSNPTVQARSYLALGDYHWAMYNVPVSPEAATRPGEHPDQSPQELLQGAEDNYRKARAAQDEAGDIIASALDGLAVVAEARALREDQASGYKTTSAHWEAARKHYQEIIDHPRVPQVLKNVAAQKIETLSSRQQPVWLADPAATQALATQPTTRRGLGGFVGPPAPGTRPATNEAVEPPAPSTRPATNPAR
jgi:hypothetical protein